jgi:sec-independent protein translocase protein TatA
MGSIGAPELLVIALLALLLFGAGRIADIGKGLGQGIKNFKQGLKEANDDDDKDEKAEKSEKSDKKEAKSKPKDESPKEA